MTPVKFILRYIAVPLMAIVAVVFWASLHSSVEIDARQYASLSAAYASFPMDLRRRWYGNRSTTELRLTGRRTVRKTLPVSGQDWSRS
jgi:hypothetical protein